MQRRNRAAVEAVEKMAEDRLLANQVARVDEEDLKRRIEEFLDDPINVQGAEAELRGNVGFSEKCHAAIPFFMYKPPGRIITISQGNSKCLGNGSFGAVFQHPEQEDAVVKVLVMTEVKVRTQAINGKAKHTVLSIQSDASKELDLMHQAYLLGCAPRVSKQQAWCYFACDANLKIPSYFKIANVVGARNAQQCWSYDRVDVFKMNTTWPCIEMEKALPWPGLPTEDLALDLCKCVINLNMPVDLGTPGIFHNDVYTRNAMTSIDRTRALLVDFGISNPLRPGLRSLHSKPLDSFVDDSASGRFRISSLKFPRSKPGDVLSLVEKKIKVTSVTPFHMYLALATQRLVVDPVSWYIEVHQQNLQSQRFKGSTPGDLLASGTLSAVIRMQQLEWATRVLGVIKDKNLQQKVVRVVAQAQNNRLGRLLSLREIKEQLDKGVRLVKPVPVPLTLRKPVVPPASNMQRRDAAAAEPSQPAPPPKPSGKPSKPVSKKEAERRKKMAKVKKVEPIKLAPPEIPKIEQVDAPAAFPKVYPTIQRRPTADTEQKDSDLSPLVKPFWEMRVTQKTPPGDVVMNEPDLDEPVLVIGARKSPSPIVIEEEEKQQQNDTQTPAVRRSPVQEEKQYAVAASSLTAEESIHPITAQAPGSFLDLDPLDDSPRMPTPPPEESQRSPPLHAPSSIVEPLLLAGAVPPRSPSPPPDEEVSPPSSPSPPPVFIDPRSPVPRPAPNMLSRISEGSEEEEEEEEEYMTFSDEQNAFFVQFFLSQFNN